MKKTLILISLLFTIVGANAQKNQNVYFLKNSGVEVVKDSADFVRIIQEPDSGETNFSYLEYHMNGKRKTLGKVSAFEPKIVMEGVTLRFNKEGKRIEITPYEKGIPLGMSYHYFNNGQLHQQIEYGNFTPNPAQSMGLTNDIPIPSFNPNSKLIFMADSLGVVYVKDGNGHVKDIKIIAKNVITDEGDYKDGVKDGVWKGSQTSPDISYVETYEMGKLITGESIQGNQKYQYKSNSFSPPQFRGGIQRFYEHIGASMKYPSDAVRNNITGSVLIGYTVDKDGSISDVIVKKSVYPALDDEAIRVVKSSPRWIPATERGVPVRVKYTIPIKFSMSR